MDQSTITANASPSEAQQGRRRQQPTTKKECHFFNAPGGCNRGDRCPFLHVLHNEEVSTAAPGSDAVVIKPSHNTRINASKVSADTQQSESLPSPSQRQAPTQSHRPSTRNMNRTPVAKPVPKSLAQSESTNENNSSNSETAAAAQRTFEIEQLERRFRSSYKVIETSPTHTTITLDLAPSDPDFPYEIDFLHLKLTIPSTYPLPDSESWKLSVLNSNIPLGFAYNLEKGVNTHINESLGSGTTLLGYLNWLDKNMETLLGKPPAETIKFVRNAEKAPAKMEDIKHKEVESKVVPKQESSSEKPPLVETLPVVHLPEPKTYTAAELESASTKRTQELKHMLNRFRSSWQFERHDPDPLRGFTCFRLDLAPSDAQFPFRSELGPNGQLKLRIKVPAVYPLEPCEVEVVNDGLEAYKKENIAAGFLRTQKKSKTISIFQHLNWLDRNLENLMRMPKPVPPPVASASVPKSNSPASSAKTTEEVSSRVSRRPPDSDMIPYRPPTKEELEQDFSGKNSQVPSEEVDDEDFSEYSHTSDEETDDDDDDGGDGDDDDRETEAAPNVASSSSTDGAIRQGTELRLPNIQLNNISLLRCTLLNILIRCTRCKNTVEVRDLKPEDNSETRDKWIPCPTCSSLVGVRFKPGFLHENSITLGFLQLGGSTAYDLLPSSYLPTCAACSTEAMQPFKQLQRGVSTSITCRSCHTKMTVTIDNIRFIRLGGDAKIHPREEDILKLKKKKKQIRLEDGIIVGQPLPHKGACKHYLKSYRWFRFPCCGKVYPCDTCHDEAEDHDYEYAKKMICGICSREQPFSSMCIGCGNEMTKKYRGGFWEGGTGVRNKAKMNKKDPHKYKGDLKTASNKVGRVGPKTGK